MKILIIGSTGLTGLELVREAVLRGHGVTAFARRPAVLAQRSEVSVTEGDVLDPASVHRAVAGQDAVLCALGARERTDGRTQSEGTRNLLAAMKANDVRRLILISSIGVGESLKQSGIFGAFLMPALGLKKVFEDKERQERLVATSGLDWTIVRPSHLTQKPLRPAIRVVTDFQTRVGWSIPRANVAAFMLDALEGGQFIRMKPTIGS